MASFTLDSNNIPKYLLLLLYLITGTLSNFGAIDILAPQWIYLCVINILSCLYFLFFFTKPFGYRCYKVFSSSYFFLFCIYSIFYGIYAHIFMLSTQQKRLLTFPGWPILFLLIFFSFFLLYSLPNKIYFVVRLFFSFPCR